MNDDLIELFNENREVGKRLLDSLPTAIYVTDAEGRLKYFNSAAVEFSGRKPKLNTDKWCITWKLYHPDGTPMPHDTSPMAIALKEGRSLNGPEAVAERPDGEQIWFKAYPSPLRNENGDIVGGINMLMDITHQKQAEKKLRQNEQELNDFFENANVGIHWVRSDGIIKRVNQAELDMLGYSRDEYEGEHIADFHADPEVIEDILERLQNREELDDYEAQLKCKDGSIRHVLINSSVYEEDEEFIHTRCVTRDVSEIKKTEQALRGKEDRLSSKVEDMKRLHALSTRLQMQEDVENTLHEVMMASAELLNADRASVQIYDQENDILRLVSTFGFDKDFDEQFGVIDASGITTCATAMKEQKQVLVENFKNSNKFPEFGKIATSHGMNAVLSTPLFGVDNQLLGVFSMYWKNPHSPAEDKLQLLDLYTQQGARQLERRQAEQALRRSEEKYRTLFETMDEGFCILKVEFDENVKPVDWRYLETNSAFEEHTGLQDMEGKFATEVMPDLEDYWFKHYGKVALTGESAHFEDYVDELERWFEISAFRIGLPKERKIAVLFKNITERKKAREERKQLLREVKNEQKRLSEIFQHAPSFMCTMQGPDHVFERANDLYMRLVGEERDVIGRPVREVFPEVEGQGFFEMLDKVYETGEPAIMTDIPIELNRHPDSDQGLETRYLDLVYQPLRDSDGSINGIFAQGVDLTERHHAKEKLETINETLEERVKKRTKELRSYQRKLRSLASKLSKAEERERQRLATELHDKLGQMLAVAKMQVEGLQSNDIPDQILDEVEELKKVVNDALKYNQNLMAELKPPPVLNKEDVTEVLHWTAKKMEKQGLDITLEDDEQPKPVNKEIRSVLHQSVRELLQNVIKHSDTNEAQMIISREKDHVKVTVEDNGKGFDKEVNRSAPTEEGGFGLFNIQERMDWHGGIFEIDSELGKGTKATLCVPLKEKGKIDLTSQNVGEIHLPSKTTMRENNREQKVKAMLVDDHDMVRRGLRQMIEKQDDLVIVAEASNGQEAVDLARESSPDVIIMDVNMPVMDGIEATQKIKADMPNIRIIGLSLHDSEEVVKDMQRAGASSYLTKNEAFETLCVTIRKEMAIVKK